MVILFNVYAVNIYVGLILFSESFFSKLLLDISDHFAIMYNGLERVEVNCIYIRQNSLQYTLK